MLFLFQQTKQTSAIHWNPDSPHSGIKYININSTVCNRGYKGKNKMRVHTHTHTPWTCTEHTCMHMVYWNKEEGIVVWKFKELLYHRETQNRSWSDFVLQISQWIVWVKQFSYNYRHTQKKSSRKLSNQQTIKHTVILTKAVYVGYLSTNLKDMKNTRTHTL